MDLSDHGDETQGATGWGSQTLEKGAIVTCDDCEKPSKVVLMKTVTVIHLVVDRGS